MKRNSIIALFLILALLCSACGPKSADNDNGDTKNPQSGDDAIVVPEPEEGVTLSTVMGATGEIIRYSTNDDNKAEKEDPSTLYVGQTIHIQKGDPGSGSDSPLYYLAFDPLVTFDYATGEYIGKVVKEWDLADDCLSMTFSIHDNIYFHNGQHATMEDVFFTFERWANPKVAFTADTFIWSNIDFEKSEIINDYNAKLVFKTPAATIISGMAKCYLVSKDHITTNTEDNAWWDNTVGTGPFKIESIVQGDRYNLIKNENYWGEPAAYDKCVIRYYAEASTMFVDYETGNLDIILSPLTADVQRVIDDLVDNTVCDLYPMLSAYTLNFNEEKNPIFENENLRKAISLALDPEIIAEAGFEFLGSAATSLLPSGLRYRYSTEHVYDVEAAKQALEDAGYKPGELTLVYGTSNLQNNILIAEAVQAQLGEIGINVEIKTVDSASHVMNLKNVGPDTYDMLCGVMFFANAEPQNFIMNVAQALKSTSLSTIVDPKVDEIALKIKSATTEEDIEAGMLELQEYILDHYWAVPLIDVKTAVVYRDYIEGINVIYPRSPDLTRVTFG